MKKLGVLLITFCLMVCLMGCSEIISEKYQNVEVIIVDTYHRETYVTHMRVGKIMTTQVHPEKCQIVVTYEGIEHTISGRETYNKYKNKVGETTEGVLRIRKYDDGSVEYDIMELK